MLRSPWSQGVITHHAFDAARNVAPATGARRPRCGVRGESPDESGAGPDGGAARCRQHATGDAEGVRKGQRVAIAGLGKRAGRRLVHQGANGKVGELKAPRFLSHQLRRLAAEDPLRAAQMRLEFVKGGLNFPPLVMKRRQCGGWGARACTNRSTKSRSMAA